jgi:hypothetical protein
VLLHQLVLLECLRQRLLMLHHWVGVHLRLLCLLNLLADLQFSASLLNTPASAVVASVPPVLDGIVTSAS